MYQHHLAHHSLPGSFQADNIVPGGRTRAPLVTAVPLHQPAAGSQGELPEPAAAEIENAQIALLPRGDFHQEPHGIPGRIRPGKTQGHGLPVSPVRKHDNFPGGNPALGEEAQHTDFMTLADRALQVGKNPVAGQHIG